MVAFRLGPVLLASVLCTACLSVTAVPPTAQSVPTAPPVATQPPSPTPNAATRAVATVAANATSQAGGVRVVATEPPRSAATATPRPAPTARPTATVNAATQVPRPRDWKSFEKSEKPRYDIDAVYPELQDGVPGAQAFNAHVRKVAQQRLESFKKDMSTWEVPPDIGVPSALGIGYTTTLVAPGIVSVHIENYSYYAGAAHPNVDSVSINFDLASGAPLTLASQFKPGSDGLKLIADYSTRELRRKLGRGLEEKGAMPTVENYARWNLTPKGLRITFDAYQVAAYADGAQVVLVPRSVLQPAIAPGSALDRFVK